MHEFDTYFNGSGSTEAIFPVKEVPINVRMNGTSLKRMFLINADKIHGKGLVVGYLCEAFLVNKLLFYFTLQQLRLTDKSDHSKMYVSTVDMGSFNELKQEQSLHVTFPGFVENLISLLDKCFKGEMCIGLTSCSGNEFQSEELSLQFFEVRPFKNLVHLILPVKLASTSVVLFHVNMLVDNLKVSCLYMCSSIILR